MPKGKVLDGSKALLILREFPDEFIKTPNNELFCKICNAIVNCDKRFRVESHKGASKHKKLLSVIAGGSKLPTIAMPCLQ